MSSDRTWYLCLWGQQSYKQFWAIPYIQNCASVQKPESGFDQLGYNCNDLAAHEHLSQYNAFIDTNYLQMISLELLRTPIG